MLDFDLFLCAVCGDSFIPCAKRGKQSSYTYRMKDFVKLKRESLTNHPTSGAEFGFLQIT